MDKEELYHHGVLGQKWGVRRDRRLLANTNYNSSLRKAKNRLASGKIDKESYKATKKDLKSKRAYEMSKMGVNDVFAEGRRKGLSDAQIRKNHRQMTNAKVSAAGVKRGLRTFNSAYWTFQTGSAAVAAGALFASGLGGIAVGSGLATVAITEGGRWVSNKILDKVS